MLRKFPANAQMIDGEHTQWMIVEDAQGMIGEGAQRQAKAGEWWGVFPSSTGHAGSRLVRRSWDLCLTELSRRADIRLADAVQALPGGVVGIAAPEPCMLELAVRYAVPRRAV